MALWRCKRCGTAFAVGLPYCPQCTSTDHEEDGAMPKITREGGVTDATLNPPGDTADTERSEYEELTVEELKAEIDDRNTGRDDDQHLPKSGNKADLVQRLVDDDNAGEPVE